MVVRTVRKVLCHDDFMNFHGDHPCYEEKNRLFVIMSKGRRKSDRYRCIAWSAY